MTEMTFGNFQDDDPPPPPRTASLTSEQPVVRMTLDVGRLPIDVQVDSQWDRKVSPHEMGAEIFQGYVQALWRHDREALESGELERLSSFPSRRERHLSLLEARTLDEHRALLVSFFDSGTYVGRSRLLDRWDVPAVTLTADRGTVRSATVSSEWAAEADANAIVGEILSCADQLRESRPSHRSICRYDNLSDAEVEERYAAHLAELTRTAAIR